jgi:hypothetical protein
MPGKVNSLIPILKMAATTSEACAMVCAESLMDLLVLLDNSLAVWSGLQF